MKTLFLPLGKLTKMGSGLMAMDLTIAAEAIRAENRLELALVLDNTGSMNCVDVVSSCALNWSSPPADSRIVKLKEAANNLVDTLMPDGLEDPDMVKIAVVPFEGAVNVASTGFDVTNPPSWIDWSNKANATTYNGVSFRADQVNTDGVSGNDRPGHRWLFNRLTASASAIKWAGCVEMRAGAYELSDDAPDTAVPASLFVPYFAPDEPDSDNDDGDTYSNDYLKDKTTSNGAAAQAHTSKYTAANLTWQSNSKKDSTPPYEYGPNRGCPQPIVALTPGDATGKAKVKAAIDGMIAFWASGTYIPTGLVWGWHVLSPGVPYTEGLDEDDEYFEETVKAMVLLSDGDNQVQPGNHTHNRSNYSAYGYVKPYTGTSRLDPVGSTPSATDAEAMLDTKTASLCTDVKDEGNIRLYTITFGTVTEATKTMMRNCASVDEGEALYYHAPSPDDLEEIFDAIGEDLSKVHLSS
jgi:hypothetical protein